MLYQVLLRGGTAYRDMLKDEESRREDGDIDIEVHNKLTIGVVSCPLFEAFDCVTYYKKGYSFQSP